MTEITDVKWHDIDNTYQKLISYDNQYIPYDFKSSYPNALDYFRRMRDALSLGYVYQNAQIQSIDSDTLYNIINNIDHTTGATREEIITTLKYADTHAATLHDELYQQYLLTDIIHLTNDVAHSNDELNKLINEFNQRINGFTHNKIQLRTGKSNSNLFPSIDEIIKKLQEEIKTLLSEIENNNKFILILVEMNECMLLIIAVAALWLHNLQCFEIYFTSNASLAGLDILVANQKKYVTYFNS